MELNSIIYIIIVIIASWFVGFATGRFGDKYWGMMDGPHHWIGGLVMMVIGAFNYFDIVGIAFAAFGLGHFISDLDDFINLRIWGVDVEHEWRFWSIK